MTARVPMVSLERARELGEGMGLPARRTQSEAFRTVANNPGVARVAFSQLMQLLENNKLDTRLRELMIMRIGWVTGSAYAWTQPCRVAGTARSETPTDPKPAPLAPLPPPCVHSVGMAPRTLSKTLRPRSHTTRPCHAH